MPRVKDLSFTAAACVVASLNQPPNMTLYTFGSLITLARLASVTMTNS